MKGRRRARIFALCGAGLAALLLSATAGPPALAQTCSFGNGGGSGSGGGGATLVTITVDGDPSDWSPVLANSSQLTRDGEWANCPTSTDRDYTNVPGCQSRSITGRDLAAFAWTYDGDEVYLYVRRYGSASNTQTFYFYMDLDGNQRMNSGEKVYQVQLSGSNRRTTGTLYSYFAADPLNGDPLVAPAGYPYPGYADGYTVPGTLGSPVTIYSNVTGGFADGTGFEARIPWSSIGVAAGTAIYFHVSTSNTSNPGQVPASIDDNLGGVDGGGGAFAFYLVSVTPDGASAVNASNPTVVEYLHTVTNSGTLADRYDLTAFSSYGFRVDLYDEAASALMATDQDGDGSFSQAGDYVNPSYDSNADGRPDTPLLAPASAFGVRIRITAPAGVTRIQDETRLSAFSQGDADLCASALDTTAIGDATLTPSPQAASVVPGQTVAYPLTLGNFSGSDVFDIQALSSQGWRVDLYAGSTLAASDFTGDGTWDSVSPGYDANGNGRPDFGTLPSGGAVSFTLVLTAPSGASVGTLETTTVTAQGSTFGTTAVATLSSTVRLRLTLGPSYTVAGKTNKYSGQGRSVFYAHTLINSWPSPDTVSFSYTSSPAGWTLRIYTDPDGDGNPSDGVPITGPLSLPANGGSQDLVVEVVIPSGLTLPLTHTAVVTAAGSSSSATATDEVRVSYVASYADANHTLAKRIFSRCQTIFMQGSSLVPASNYRFRLLDSNGVEIRNQPALSDGNGEASDTYTLTATDSVGTWTLELYNASSVLVDSLAIYVDPPPSNPSTVAPVVAGRASYALTGNDLSVTATFNNTSTGADYTGTLFRYLVRTPDLSAYLRSDGTFASYTGAELTRATGPHDVDALTSVTETTSVGGVQFPSPGVYRTDVVWMGSCANTIASAVLYFPVGTTLASYGDGAYSQPCEAFRSGQTVYLSGSTYLPSTSYSVAYYDPSGNRVLTQSTTSTGGGLLGTSATVDQLGSQGLWHVAVYPSTTAPPLEYSPGDPAAAASDSFSLDWTLPAAPVLTAPADGSATTDTTPDFLGTAEPFAVVTLVLDGGPAVTVTADASGNWSYTPASPLSYGPHSVFATATDAAGNVSPPSPTSAFTVQHSPPSVAGPVVASPLGNTISGTSPSPPGTTITVYVNGAAAGTTTVQSGGTWSLPGVQGLVGGENLTATAGTGASQSAVSAAVGVTPYPPVVNSPAYAGATSVAGTSGQPEGSTITVYKNGAPLGTATVQADGTWILGGLAVPLAGGDLLAAAATAGGQTSALSAEVVVSSGAAGVTPPPMVASPIYAGAVRVSGTSASPVGTRIDVYVDGAYVGTATVASGGVWTFNLPSGTALRDGQRVSATATDGGDGLGTSVPSPEVVVSASAGDRTPSPTVTSPVYGGDTSVSGTSTSPAGTRIDVYADGVFLGTTTVQAGGGWTLSGVGPLSGGTVLRATATDEAGGHGTSTPSAPVTVVGVQSAPPIVSASLSAGSTPTLFGSSVEAAGSLITVYVNGASVGTTTVGADGSWSLPGPALSEGDLVRATVLAAGKSVSGDSNTVRVAGGAAGTTPPPSVSSPIASGAVSLSGTAQAGAAVDVYADGVYLGTALADGSGLWTLSGVAPIADGAVVSATATLSPAGTSDWSAPVVAGTAVHLLRSDALTSLNQDRRPIFTHAVATPPYPSLETLGPNHAFNAAEGADGLQPSAPGSVDDDKGYLRNVTTGTTDPDPTVLSDNGRPLVFYELLDNNTKTLKLEKAGSSIRFRVE